MLWLNNGAAFDPQCQALVAQIWWSLPGLDGQFFVATIEFPGPAGKSPGLIFRWFRPERRFWPLIRPVVRSSPALSSPFARPYLLIKASFWHYVPLRPIYGLFTKLPLCILSRADAKQYTIISKIKGRKIFMNLKAFFLRSGVSLLVALPAPIIFLGLVRVFVPDSQELIAGMVNPTDQMNLSYSLYGVATAASFIVTLFGLYISQTLVNDSGIDDREEGVVKWFNVSKGFGFITRDNGDDVFVHFRSIRGRGHRSLQEGQKVKFGLVESAKGLQAEDVSVIRHQ